MLKNDIKKLEASGGAAITPLPRPARPGPVRPSPAQPVLAWPGRPNLALKAKGRPGSRGAGLVGTSGGDRK